MRRMMRARTAFRWALAALALAMAANASAAPAPLRFAWLRDGNARLWTFGPGDAAGPPGRGVALSSDFETQLGSVWKLFVYVYLLDRRLPAPDYECMGNDKEEIYCCAPGGHIDRDHALVQSCGLFFDARRLKLDPEDWRRYWRERNAPTWVQDIAALGPKRRVAVLDLLRALEAVPARVRNDTGDTLVSVVTGGRGLGTVSWYGGLFRVKTWTMPGPANSGGHQGGHSGGYEGGAAGWLADGTPVWLGGHGSSPRVLAEAAPHIAPLVAASAVPDDRACVTVDFFSRYPIRAVHDAHGRPTPFGALIGAFEVSFENGRRLPIESRGELLLDHGESGKPVIVGHLGMNDYVARVVAREGDAAQPAAGRALAVAARSYLVENAGRDRGCYRIDDSSRTQRVLPRPPDKGARAAADFTDGLVLAGASVRIHHDKAGPGRMSWLAAKAEAGRGLAFDAILSRVWPDAPLMSFAGGFADGCVAVAGARDWLGRQASKWDARLAGEAGYEKPELPAVCEVASGRPYTDAGRGRVYVRGLNSEDDRIALAHEYLHLAFAHHPRGQNETFIEQTARRLILTGN